MSIPAKPQVGPDTILYYAYVLINGLAESIVNSSVLRVAELLRNRSIRVFPIVTVIVFPSCRHTPDRRPEQRVVWPCGSLPLHLNGSLFFNMAKAGDVLDHQRQFRINMLFLTLQINW